MHQLKEARYDLTFHPEFLSTVGPDLVRDPAAAIIELVKNGYDADASSVTVRFTGEGPSAGVLEIDDNGHGMTDDVIERGWLVVSTPLKRDAMRTQSGKRVVSGSKGMGRLAAFTLGGHVRVISSVDGKGWRGFSLDLNDLSSKKAISEWHVDVKDVAAPREGRGTIVQVSKLTWWPETPDDRKRLRRRLAALIAPRNPMGFKIRIELGSEGEDLSPLLDLPHPQITVSARVDETGEAHCTLQASKLAYTGPVKLDEPSRIYHSREDTFEQAPDNFSEIIGAEFEALWLILGDRPDSIRYWEVAERGGALRKELKEIAGIRIYRDGIRVYPYGEPGDDWLSLEREYTSRGAIGRFPRAVSLIGWTYISRERHVGLVDTINREGLKTGLAFYQLQKFLRWTLECLADWRLTLEPVHSEKQVRVTDLKDAMKAVKALRKTKEITPELFEKLSAVEKVVAGFRDHEQAAATYRHHLTAGVLVNLILHDVGSAVTEGKHLITLASKQNCALPMHRDALDLMAALMPQVLASYETLRQTAKIGSHRSREFWLDEEVAEIVKMVSQIGKPRAFKVDVAVPHAKAYMRPSDLWSITLNLLLNAMNASQYRQSAGRKLDKQRKAILIVSALETDLRIVCDDNGPGLPEKPTEWIWEPFHSTRRGGGAGLGLFIISDIVNWYGGTKSASSSKEFASGARFDLFLKGVLVND